MLKSLVFKTSLFLALGLSLHFFTYLKTDGFRLHKVCLKHSYSFDETFQDPPPCLKQPFFYLGKGVQFYVFVGEDNQTILKLFKHHHMGPSIDTFKKFRPLSLFLQLIAKREKRMCRLFQSARIAKHDLEDQTGVFYTHLSKTQGQLGTATIYDKIGIVYKIDLDQTEFVLQEKAETVETRLHSLFSSGQISDAILAIKNLQDLIEQRSRMEIKNKDGRLLENCGFIGEKPIQIDIGSLAYRSSSDHQNPHRKAKVKCTLEMLGWVKTYYPDHLNTCKKELFYENAI